ncbi:ARID DNA-binding domain-containing protein [Tanacetum coccineum]
MQKSEPKQTSSDKVQTQALQDGEAESEVYIESIKFDFLYSSMELINPPVCNESEPFSCNVIGEEESFITYTVNERSKLIPDEELLEESSIAPLVVESSHASSDKEESLISKSGRHLRRRQQLDFIQRELRREKEAQLGSCIKQISKDCKEMLKKKMEEIMQYNNTINQPQSINNAQNRFRRYKCFHCKQRGHILKFCPMDDKNKDMATKRDTSEFAKETKEVIKPTKPSVMLKYPKCIHFSTTCMIKGTDHANWDDI